MPKGTTHCFNGLPMLIRSAEFDAAREMLSKMDGTQIAALSAMTPARVDNSMVRRFGSVAVIRLEGIMTPMASIFDIIFGSVSVHSWVQKDLNAAVADPNVSAIVLDINSPGGYVNGTAELADMVRRADAAKPVYAFTSGMIASAAYWVASHARGIVATPGAEIGSIGVVGTYMKQESADRDGYKVLEFTSSNAKAKRPDPTTPEGMAVIQRELDNVENLFISAVAQARGLSADFVKSNFGNGAMFMAAEALDRKMITEISSFDDFISRLNGKKGGNMPEPKNANADGGQIAAITSSANPAAIAPAMPPADAPNAVESAVSAERARCSKIIQSGTLAGMSASDIQSAIDGAESVESFQSKALAAKVTNDNIDASGYPANGNSARKSLADLVEAKYGKKKEA